MFSLQLSSIGDKWLYGGEYVAEAKNKHGKAQCSTLVFVAGVFRIRDQEKTTFYHGQKMSLTCYVISESRPEVRILAVDVIVLIIIIFLDSLVSIRE